jgi:hypothetical protein
MRKFLPLLVFTGSVLILYYSCQKKREIPTPLNEEQPVSSVNTGNPANELDVLPDLTIDAQRLQSSVIIRTKVFKPGDCAVFEGCVGGSGKRKLMRFDVATPNIGAGDLFLGSPVNNPLFSFSQCHRHYHFNGYANYELLNDAGTNVLTGHKQAFCLMDYSRYDPSAGPAQYTCSYQGISAGWQDVYGSYLDCQWLDITGIAKGDYLLRVTINPDRILTESNYVNNVATVPVSINK